MKIEFVRKIAILFLVIATTLQAQQNEYRLQSAITGKAGVNFTSWKAGVESINEFAMPFSLKYPVNDKLQIYLVTAPAFARLNAGGSYRLGGLSDIKAGGHYLFWNDNLLFTFGLNLPAGNSRLTAREWKVASVLSRANFSFPVPGFGQGFDVQLGLSSGLDINGWMLGAGISYLKKGGFKPYEYNDIQYSPGDEITFTLGINRNSFYADFIYSVYQIDKNESKEVFRAGASLVSQLMWSFKMGNINYVIFIRDRIKGKSSFYSNGAIAYSRIFSNKNQFDFQAGGNYQFNKQIRLRGFLYCKIYSNNDNNFGAMKLFGPGIGCDYGVEENIVVYTDLKFGFGKLSTRNVNEVNLSGISISGGLQISL